jgi:Tfp pilus assembly protein PilW
MNTTPRLGRRPGNAAFTLTEIMVVMNIFMLVILGMVTANIFGLRAVEYVKPKLGASEDSRRAINLLTAEIRSASLIRIGQGDSGSFTEVGRDTSQQGSAIQIYPTTNTIGWVRYYLDAADKKLKRVSDATDTPVVIASSISNSLVFSSENFAGAVLTNNRNNRVIGLLLQFYQIQYPVTPIGPGNYFDYYQLHTRITRRSLF